LRGQTLFTGNCKFQAMETVSNPGASSCKNWALSDMHIKSFLTSHGTKSIPSKKTKQLKPFSEIIDVDFGDLTKHLNALWGKISEILNVIALCTCNNHSALNA
jgi:hypothetical protein